MGDWTTKLLIHEFKNRFTSQGVRRLSREPPPGWVQGVIDFGENKEFYKWWAEQQEHWQHKQMTIMPVPIRIGIEPVDIGGGKKQCFKQVNFIFLSDDHSHSPAFIQLCILHIFLWLMLKKIVVKVFQMCSDRCAAQFFNSKMFLFLTRLKQITARMAKLMSEGGDLSEFRVEGATEEERQMQQEKERDDTCRGSSYTVSMPHAAVQGGFYLTLGKDSSIVSNLPVEGGVVKLVDTEGEATEGRYQGGSRHGFSVGWRAFARGHSLKVGDKVEFIMRNAGMIDVKITRAETPVPIERAQTPACLKCSGVEGLKVSELRQSW